MSTMLPHERGDGKIQGWHRDRLAAVYVRQSSRQQVVDHGESTRLQYGLAERAVALGWPASRVMVIDEDLGRSAADAAERPGFARLVAELTMGHVGLVLGLEMSRLARAGRDWHQLIELCSLAGALLADADGVYDPNWYNDRLLLGLKGTMSEFLSGHRHKTSLGYPFNRSSAGQSHDTSNRTNGHFGAMTSTNVGYLPRTAPLRWRAQRPLMRTSPLCRPCGGSAGGAAPAGEERSA